jgi:hypothetical protein
MTYRFRNFVVPDRIMSGLLRWIEHGTAPGGFLTAVLNNDLKNAIGNADEECMANLPAIVGYLYNEAPASCWGSKDRFEAWPALLQERKERA